MLNIDDAMITVDARPAEVELPNHWALQDYNDRMRWAEQTTGDTRQHWLNLAAKAHRIYLDSCRFHAQHSAFLMRGLAVLLIAASLHASPLSWAKRHPRTMKAVSAAGMMSAGLLRSRGQRPNQPVGQPLKAISCTECRQVGR